MTGIYDDTAMERRNRRKIEDQAVQLFRDGARRLTLHAGYKRNLISRIRAAKHPMRESQRFLRQLKPTHAKPAKGSSVPDLSAATEARASLLRRQPVAYRRWPAFDDELGELERALLKGQVSQQKFDRRCQKIAAQPLPGWMNG